MDLPLRLPPSVACGMISISPGKSNTDTNLPLSLSLNLAPTTDFTEMQQAKQLLYMNTTVKLS